VTLLAGSVHEWRLCPPEIYICVFGEQDTPQRAEMADRGGAACAAAAKCMCVAGRTLTPPHRRGLFLVSLAAAWPPPG